MRLTDRILVLFLFTITNIGLNAQQMPVNFQLLGNSLVKTNDSTPKGNSVEKIIYVNNTIWLATSNGLSKSTDNGNSWTNYSDNEPFKDKAVSTIAFKDGVIWAALWHGINVNGQFDGAGDGLVYSLDEGNTWTHIPQPIDAKSDTIVFYGSNSLWAQAVTVTGQNFVYGITLTNNTVWIVSRAGGLRKSTDMGKTWQRVPLPPDTLDSISPNDVLNFEIRGKAGNNGSNNHIGLAIYAVDDDTIYVGTAGGLNKSTDGGISWTKFNYTNQSNPISGNRIWRINQNKFDGSIWAATWRAEDNAEFMALSRSTNGGRTWEILMPQIISYDIGFRYYGSENNYTDYDVLNATQEGLFRSDNKLTSWIAAPEMIDKSTKRSITSQEFRAVTGILNDNNTADIWIGTSGSGLIKYEDLNGSWNGDWTVYLSSGEPIPVQETFAFPNPFSPDAEVVRIKYNVENNSDVTIRIFDFGMNLVRTVIQNASRGINNEQIEIWDGKDEIGRIVPNGVYFYRIDVGSQEPLFGKIMVLM